MLAAAQAAIGISSDRHFLDLIGRVLPGAGFPNLPDQSEYNRAARGLVELISIVQQKLARWLDSGPPAFARFGFAQSAVARHAPSPPTTAAESHQPSS